MYLETLNSPLELKRLSPAQLPQLAAEIRQVLITRLSITGGHLASNLGLVETTISLHYVFNSPVDKIVFDVSHQCYTHKILTGRKKAFTDRELYHTVNGYTNPEESEHDFFKVGHSATAISLATGLAKARDLLGGQENVIAVVGDGALGGGEAFEGLNFGGSGIQGNLIVIFNDNQMSIPEVHGGIYPRLKALRDSDGQASDNLFKACGYDYVFVRDGHDFTSLLSALHQVKDLDHPVVVHVCTVKGKGYAYAESHPEETHWVRRFDLGSGAELNPFHGERYDRIVRDLLLQKMAHDLKVVTLIASVPGALDFNKIQRTAAGRQFIDVGIAEEHAISMAAGLARRGCKPVFATFATFFQRTYDQISQELCINRLPATLIVCNASVYAVNDVTHIGIFDIPLLSNIPNLVYLAPANRQEYLAMLDWSIEQRDWPVAIRAPRNGIFESSYAVEQDYSVLNKYKVVVEGEQIAILALGDFFQLGDEVAQQITAEFGLRPTLVNPRYITGLDRELLEQLKERHQIVITFEDGILDGGFGQKIAGFYGASEIKVLTYGLRKEFLDRYNLKEVLESNHLTPEHVLSDLQQVLSKPYSGV